MTENSHRYLKETETREEGGTPAIVESIRAGLVFQLKEVRFFYVTTQGVIMCLYLRIQCTLTFTVATTIVYSIFTDRQLDGLVG